MHALFLWPMLMYLFVLALSSEQYIINKDLNFIAEISGNSFDHIDEPCTEQLSDHTSNDYEVLNAIYDVLQTQETPIETAEQANDTALLVATDSFGATTQVVQQSKDTIPEIEQEIEPVIIPEIESKTIKFEPRTHNILSHIQENFSELQESSFSRLETEAFNKRTIVVRIWKNILAKWRQLAHNLLEMFSMIFKR